MKNLLRALNPFIAYNNLQFAIRSSLWEIRVQVFYYGQPVKLNNQLN